MVVGLNPHRPFDADYLSFLKLITGQVSSSLASAEAYEAERRRSAALAEAAELRQAAAQALEQANARLAAEVRQRTAERDRLRTLFQRAPGFMCVLHGPDHVFEFMNEAYRQLVGHRDLTGLPIREALPEIAGQGYFELLDEVYRTGQPFVGRKLDVLLQREPAAPLEQRCVNLVYQPVVEADGTVTGIFAEGHDVTDQKRAEEALRNANETLEQRIATAINERERIEEALRQSQKMEAVGQLTGGLAHDFNNLLTGITGSLELLGTRLAQGRLKDLERYIVAAQGAANRAAALTHRLLAFSRRQTLDPKPTIINRLLSDMEDLIRRSIGPAITLEIVGSAGLWTTSVDPNQLENALLNLCINARDAMPGGGRLTVETSNRWIDARAGRERELTPGQYVSLCVSDTGTGMPPDVVARAFDPFFTTKPLGMGTGLGLSMIYGFAKQSGGQVRIYSEVGQGTMVCLYLPRHYGDAESSEKPADLGEAPRAKPGETVLIVDDEPAIRMLVSEVLEDLGYTAIEAADGPAGLKLLQSDRRIDLLITDVGLPGGMNGRQVADAARSLRPGLKVLFITGYAENAALGNGHLDPGMQILTKPFVMETIASRIKDLIAEA
jgi:signal transduction histidine kinase